MDSNDQDKILNTDSEKVLENTSTFTNSSGSEVKKTKVQPKSYYPCHLCHRKFQALRGLHYHQHYMHGLETPKKKVIIKRNLNVRQKAYSGIPSLMKQLQETENANKESVSDLKPPEPKRQKTDDNDNNLEQRSSRSCNICLFNSSAEDCKNHMTSHQFLFPYDCKKCHWRFDSKLKLIEHTQYCQDNHGDSVKIFISKIGNNPRNSYTVSLDTPDHLKEPLTRDVNSPSEKSNVSFEQISKLYAAQHNDLKLLKGPRVVLKRLQKEDISKWQFGPSPQTFCAMLSQNCDGLLMKIRKTNLEQSAQKEGALTKTVYSSDNCKDSFDGTSKNSAECGNEGDQSMIPQESEENENPNKKTNNFLCNLLNKGNTSSDVPISVCKVGDTAPSTVEKPVSTVTVNPIVVKSVTVPLPSSTSLAVAKPTLPNSASKVTGEVAANNSRLNIIDGSNSGKTVNSGDNIDEQVAVIVERIMSTSGMQCSTNTVGIKSISANENTTQKHTELTSLSPNLKSPSNSEASNSFLPTLANLLKNSPKAANPQPLNKQSNVHSLKRSTVVKAQNNSGTQRMTVSQIINGVGNYKCPTCERYFKSKYSLETHLLIHQDLRPFPCPICSKPFRQKCTLTRHMLVHRENMIECDKCKKIFQNPAEFQSHLSHCAEGARGRILKPNTLTSSSVIQATNPNMLRANMQNLQNRNFVNNSVAARAAVQRSGTIIHPNPNRQMQNRKMLNNEVIEIEDDDEIIEVNKQKLLQQQMVSARRNSAGTTSISANSAYPVIQNVCSAGISLPSSSGTPPGTSKTMTISVTSAPLEKLPLKSNNPSNPYISQIMQNKQITLTPVQKPEQSNSSGIITNSQLPHPLPVPTPLLKNKELTIVPLTTSSINTKNDSVTIIPVATTNSPDHRTMSSVHAQSSSKVAGVSITPVAQKASPNQFLHSRLTQNSTYSQSQQHHNSASYSVAPPPPPLIPIQGTPSSMRVQHIPVSGSNSINQISYSSYNQRSNAGNEYSNRQGGAFSNQTGQYQRSYSGNAAAAAAAATAATTAATTYQQQLQQRLYQQRISQQQQLAQQRQLAQQQLAQRQQMNQQRQLAQQQQQLVQQMAQQNRHNAAVYPNAGPNPNTNQSIRYPSVSRYPQYRSLPQQASSATSQQRGSYGYPYATQAYNGPAPNVQLQQRLQGYVPSHTGQRMPQATPYGKYPPHPPVPPYSAVSSPQVLNKNNPLSTLSQFVETNTSPSQPSTPSWHHPSTSEANAYFNQKSTSSISQNTSYYSTNPQASTASTWFPQSGIPPATQPNIINVAACEIPDNQTATANLNASTNKENQTRFSSQASNPVQDIEAMSCGICSQVFSDDAMLSAHLLTHTDQNGDLDVILCSEVPKVDFFNVKQEKVEEASKSSDNTTNENQEEEILNTPKFRNLSNVLLLSDEEDVETNTPEPEASPANFNSGSAVQIDKDQVMVVEVVEPEVVPVIPHQTLAATVIEDFQSPTTVIEENQTTDETVIIEENNIDETATMGSPVPEVEDEPCHDSIDELENGDMLGKEIEQPTVVDVYMTSKEIQDVKKDLNKRSTEDNNIVASIIASICKSVETGLPYATETDFQIKRFNDISKVKDDNEFYYDTMEACEKSSSHVQSEIDIDENIAEDLASDHEDGTDSQSPNMNIERHLEEEHTELETNLMDCDETADDVNSKHFSDNFASSPSSINALDLSIEKSCSCSSLNISGETPGTCCPDEDMSINEDPISLQLSDNEDETQYEDNSEMNVVTQEQSFNIESLHSAYQDSIIEEDEEEEDGMKVGESVLGYYSDRVSEEMQNWSSSNGEAFTVQFSCPICDQVFGTQQLFYKHLVMHQEPLNSSCNYCSKTFASPQQLKKHLKQHLWQNHLKNSVSYRKRVHDHYKFLPPRMAFKCKICSKKFFNFKLYRIHHRQCGKSWTAAKTLAIPIIDLQTVARNTNNLESLGITGFIPLMSQAHSNSESSSLMQKLGIPLVDTKNLQAEHLRNLAELEINQSLLLDGLQTVDNILEDHSNVINQDLSNIRDSEMESFSEVQKSDSCAQSEYSEETSNVDSIDVSKVDGVSNGKADSISSPELDKGLIQELEMEEISETDVLIPKAETASELSNLKDELTISVVSSESDTIITKDSVEDMVPKVNHLSPSQQIDNGKDQVNGFTKNQEETGPSQETLDNLKKLGLMIEVRSLASEICVSTVDKTDK